MIRPGAIRRLRPAHRVRPAVVAALVAALAACASYEPQPLRPAAELSAAVEDLERSPDRVSLPEAVDLLLHHNQQVVGALGRWREQRAVASVATPLANPTLEVGPVYLSGGSWGLEAALGWVLPLSGRRGILDDRNATAARAAELSAIATAREQYLGLRADLLATAAAADRVALEDASAAVLGGIVAEQQRLGADATMSALDLRLIELEWRLHQSRRAATEAALVQARSACATRCGVAAQRLAELPLQVRPPLPEALPEVAALRELLLEHPALVRLRARYEVAEQDLRLQVRGQYPDLQIGGSLEREAGRSRFFLPLGIEVPLDGNATGIARARAEREAIRAEYRVELRNLLNRVEGARAALEVQHARHRSLAAQVLELGGSAEQLIQAAVEAGRLDARGRALALRTLYDARLQATEARAALYETWVRLEQACGAPLLPFPGQPEPPTRLPDGAEVRR